MLAILCSGTENNFIVTLKPGTVDPFPEALLKATPTSRPAQATQEEKEAKQTVNFTTEKPPLPGQS